jgi:DNA-binding response OmpR family regulator
LEIFLDLSGYTYRSCTNARDALKVAEEFHPDVALVEYRLPDASGASVAERLRRLFPDVVVVMLSEYDSQWITKEIEHAKVHYLLKKPFDPLELEMVLDSSCSRSRGSKAQASSLRLQWKAPLSFESSPPPNWNGFTHGVLGAVDVPLRLKGPLGED